MDRDPLQFRHQGAKRRRARRRRHVKSGLRRAGEGDAVRDRRIGGDAGGVARGGARGFAAHQRELAAMGIAEPGFEPRHALPRHGEAEMGGRGDDAVHGPECQLVQVVRGGQEFGRLDAGRHRRGARRQRVRGGPAPVIQPGTRIRAALGAMAPEIVDHALEPGSGRAMRREGGVGALRHRHGDGERSVGELVQEQRMDLLGVRPEPDQRELRIARQGRSEIAPAARRQHPPRPGTGRLARPRLDDRERAHRARTQAESAPGNRRPSSKARPTCTQTTATAARPGAATGPGAADRSRRNAASRPRIQAITPAASGIGEQGRAGERGRRDQEQPGEAARGRQPGCGDERRTGRGRDRRPRCRAGRSAWRQAVNDRVRSAICRMPAEIPAAPPRPKASATSPAWPSPMQPSSRPVSSAPPRRHAGEQDRDQAQHDQRRPRPDRRTVLREHEPQPEQDEKPDIAERHRQRHRLAAAHPAMQRRQPRDAAIPHHEKGESEPEQGEVAAPPSLQQRAPVQRRQPCPESGPGREREQDRAEQAQHEQDRQRAAAAPRQAAGGGQAAEPGEEDVVGHRREQQAREHPGAPRSLGAAGRIRDCVGEGDEGGEDRQQQRGAVRSAGPAQACRRQQKRGRAAGPGSRSTARPAVRSTPAGRPRAGRRARHRARRGRRSRSCRRGPAECCASAAPPSDEDHARQRDLPHRRASARRARRHCRTRARRGPASPPGNTRPRRAAPSRSRSRRIPWAARRPAAARA